MIGFKLFIKILFRRLIKGILAMFFLSIICVVILRWIPVVVTPLMLLRKFDNGLPIRYKWIPIDEISQETQKAAIAAEDQRFLIHNGFDIDAIKQALQSNRNGKNIRGASTISQQTAKNVFLFPHRNWLRKGLEAYFTFLIEIFWSKQRIMEVYLNVIEMGPGIYGIEQASRIYFKKPARKLSAYESARIIAILPAPLKWSVVNPTSYVVNRQNMIFYMSHALPEELYIDLSRKNPPNTK